MGWGDENPKLRSVDECIALLRLKNQTFWDVLGFGDFGVAEVPEELKSAVPTAQGGWVQLDEDLVKRVDLNALRWVGYACLRDATGVITKQRETWLQEHDALPSVAYAGPLPPWQEMVEIKYGLSPDHWGKGYASEIASFLHAWGIAAHGVRRYIGGTLKTNAGSRRVLQKTGFVSNPERLWVDSDHVEFGDEWMYTVPSTS
ncbi:hypothetical protein EXIGLDRAFT_832691 [Exidia glandulosa HHB12029]|uniref:N-acetyltransferase domain-containing protein n=1 Tax=Exidia glandulosa HHB12029 TaxID=1314781 RepID=A0A165LCA8_EXIGL|nr:hypothetical protein EXIGLDRAFT_832691 [Exidia glandulosa HHB12029]